MKFGLFYFLSAPRSLNSDDWEPEKERVRFQEALDQVELADRVGFDYVYALEHHFRQEYSCLSASDLFLAAASQRTKTIRLVTGIMQNPPALNHPVRVAERAATLDLLSNGRFELGTGHGTLPELVDFLGPDLSEEFFPEGGREMWEEGTREAVRMLEDAPYPGYEGKYFSFPLINVVPKPYQKPHPPLWTAAGSVEMNGIAAASGVGALNISLLGLDAARERVEVYWDRLHQGVTPLGKTVNPAVATVAFANLAHTREVAIARSAQAMDWFGYALRRSSQTVHEPGVNINREFQLAWATDDGPNQDDPHSDGIAPAHRITSAPGCLMDSPAGALTYLAKLEETNVDSVVFAVQSGDLEQEYILETLELFGSEIIPQFKASAALHKEWRDGQLKDFPFPVYTTV